MTDHSTETSTGTTSPEPCASAPVPQPETKSLSSTGELSVRGLRGVERWLLDMQQQELERRRGTVCARLCTDELATEHHLIAVRLAIATIEEQGKTIEELRRGSIDGWRREKMGGLP